MALKSVVSEGAPLKDWLLRFSKIARALKEFLPFACNCVGQALATVISPLSANLLVGYKKLKDKCLYLPSLTGAIRLGPSGVKVAPELWQTLCKAHQVIRCLQDLNPAEPPIIIEGSP